MAIRRRSPPRPPSGPDEPSGPEQPSVWRALLEFALPQGLPDDLQARALDQLRSTLENGDDDAPRHLLEWLTGQPPPGADESSPPAGPVAFADEPLPPATPEAKRRRAMVLRLLQRALVKPFFKVTAERLEPLAKFLDRQDPESLRPLVGPALRFVLGRARDEDAEQLATWLAQFLQETSMAVTFFIDDSAIPLLANNPALEAELLARIGAELQNRFGVPKEKADPTTVSSAAAVLGMVLLDGEFDPRSSGLPDALRRAWLESIGDLPSMTNASGKVSLSEVFEYIASVKPRLNGGTTSLSMQEFAFVIREIIAGASAIPFGHPNFDSAIRIAVDKYVATRSAGDSLSLPAGSLPGGTVNAGGDADLNSDNIRVAGLVYSLALLEKTLVFRVADRLAELFMNGLLPFGHDAAGKAMDDYYWETEDRMTESQRRSQYSRMLGMPGGEVSREVTPNKDFEQLFLRFIASVSEFTRQREVDRMFTTRTSVLPMSGEQVRKCAFELAKNASLYAWGGSFFVATRINRHLDRAIGILNQPQVLKTYAASNHWQVIERVAQQDFGGAPNWAKYSTMAEASNTLFNVLANNTSVLSTSTSRPFLFDPSVASNGFGTDGQGRGDGDLSEATTNQVLRSVQSWLAVNGMRDDQVKQYAQPVELAGMPSLPGQPAARADNGLEVVNKLKQLVAGGTPSPDQLQQVLAGLN